MTKVGSNVGTRQCSTKQSSTRQPTGQGVHHEAGYQSSQDEEDHDQGRHNVGIIRCSIVQSSTRQLGLESHEAGHQSSQDEDYGQVPDQDRLSVGTRQSST